MNDFSPRPTQIRNPVTRRKHQKEMLWQVTVPMLIGTVILLALAGMAVGLAPGEAQRWADISIIWMIIPAMFLAVLSLVLLSGTIYGIMRLILVLPRYSYQALGWLLLLGLNIRRLSDRLVEPFLRVHMASASMKALGRRVSRK